MNQLAVVSVATLLLVCDVILCVPIQVTVSENSVYTNPELSNSEGHEHDSPKQEEEEFLKISLLEPTDKTRESVNLEYEAIPSKILTKYDFGQKKVADFTNPIPIIDTISESEKYGNNGDMFDGISRAIVNGYEAFSNFVNKLIGVSMPVDKPKEVARSLSKGITAQLDVIGGKLVGL